MADIIDPALVRLFGSRTRAAILGVLANSGRPLTAYRVAQVTGAQLSKVSLELRRLGLSRVIGRAPTSNVNPAWVMTDPSLRAMLRRRIRIFWLDDWNEEVGRLSRRSQTIPRLRIDLSRYRAEPQSVPNRREFLRPELKDRILTETGLRTSRRPRPRR